MFFKDGRSKEVRALKKATGGLVTANKSRKKSSSKISGGDSSFFERLVRTIIRWCCVYPFVIFVLKFLYLLIRRGPRFSLLYIKYKSTASFNHILFDGDYHDDFEDWLSGYESKTNDK